MGPLICCPDSAAFEVAAETMFLCVLSNIEFNGPLIDYRPTPLSLTYLATYPLSSV